MGAVRNHNTFYYSKAKKHMSNAEAFNLIVAIGAAIATALATLAAFRSARSANIAQQALVDEQLRNSRRDVATLIAGCSYEFTRIRFLAHTLSVIDRQSAIFAGGLGGSRQKLAIDGVSKRVSAAEDIFKAISPFSNDPIAISKLIQEDIDRLQVSLTIYLANLRTIAEELDRDSCSREAQLLQQRELNMGGSK